jgi:hypothetical protein
METDRELASDACVLRAGISPADYAAQLLAIAGATGSSKRSLRSGLGMASNLTVRIKTILNSRTNPKPVKAISGGLITCAVAALVLLVASLQLVFDSEQRTSAAASPTPGNPVAESGLQVPESRQQSEIKTKRASEKITESRPVTATQGPHKTSNEKSLLLEDNLFPALKGQPPPMLSQTLSFSQNNVSPDFNYGKAAAFDVDLSAGENATERVMATVRRFIWDHWARSVRGHLSIQFSTSGQADRSQSADKQFFRIVRASQNFLSIPPEAWRKGATGSVVSDSNRSLFSFALNFKAPWEQEKLRLAIPADAIALGPLHRMAAAGSKLPWRLDGLWHVNLVGRAEVDQKKPFAPFLIVASAVPKFSDCFIEPNTQGRWNIVLESNSLDFDDQQGLFVQRLRESFDVAEWVYEGASRNPSSLSGRDSTFGRERLRFRNSVTNHQTLL